MVSFNDLIFGGGYTDRRTITAGRPKVDGNIDMSYPTLARTTRQDINYLNVNDPNLQAIVTSLTAKTMGISINVQVTSRSETFNSEAEAFIKEHSNFGFENGRYRAMGELTGKHHFNAFARLISDFTALSGGVIIRHHYNTIWSIPYRYELIGVDMIDISKTDRVVIKGKQTTINGIVRDKYGEITDIWLYETANKTKSIKVPYQDITYFSEVWMNIDQQTAVSKMVTLLSTLDQSAQYGKAELDQAIEEAKAGHYIKSTAYNGLMKIVAKEIESATLGTGTERIQNAKDLVTPILKGLSNLGVNVKGLTPIPSDDEVQFNSAKKDSQYKDITNNSEKLMSASQGLSDIGVYNKASDANYSSIKYTLETDQRTAEIKFENISAKVFNEIFSRLIRVGIQIGRISERVSYWNAPNEYNKFRYLRRNKIDTEPAKTANAQKIKKELGTESVGDIVEESKGIPYDQFLRDNHKQKLQEMEYDLQLMLARQKRMQELGIVDTTTQGTQN